MITESKRRLGWHSVAPILYHCSRRTACAFFLIISSFSVTAQAPPADQPLPAVIVEPVVVEPISDLMQFIARVEAIESVELRARVQGFLETIAFQAGQQVSAGELLFEIEADRYEAAVASARAGVSQAEASQRQASRNLERMQSLTERQSVSRAALDEAQANAEIAEANLAAARAQLQAAELDLSYTRITAPIDGEISRSYFSSGDLVGPESGQLADIIQSDPIRVVFSLSEGALVTLRQQANQQDLQA